jgi:hypothetical protein
VRRSLLSDAGIALIVSGIMALALSGCGGSTAPTDAAEGGEAKGRPSTSSDNSAEASSKGMAAMKRAADSGKYLFLFFSKTDDDQTLAMRKVFDKAMEKVADRAQWIAISATDPSEKAIVDKFDVTRAPMPLVLAMAPNGAITGGFPAKCEEQQLLDAFATPGTEKVMKPIQDGKLVFVCVHNDKTKSNDAAMQGVRDFKNDARFVHATEIVTLDPADKKEAGFLTALRVSADTPVAVTVFVVPPGQAIGKWEGATNKDALVELLSKANTGCDPGGCGPGGCAPK